ncbi:regulatory protein RecX [Algiphilus aromaticivorans]|uniref:regulatory protein RecX n=1 Tax=Algiphilus aromaticivorans TaxID=382454 RepID=UPI0005C17E5C
MPKRSPKRRNSGEPPSAKARAVDLLSRREHGAEEMTRKLAARGLDAAEVRQAVAELSEAGWQSDERYAQAVIRQRAAQGYGPRRVRFELSQAGVAEAAVEAAMAAEAVDWLEVARDWASRRLAATADAREQAKQWRRLAGRGFEEAEVRAVMREGPGSAAD